MPEAAEPPEPFLELLRMSEALRESEAKYRALVEHVPAVVYADSNEPVPVTIYVSPSIHSLLGYTADEWVADPALWPSSVHPEDAERVLAEWAATLDSGADFVCEYHCRRKDGSFVWIRDTSTLIRDDDGKPSFWQGIMQDISEQRAAEAALRDSEARYRSLLEQVPAVVYEMGPDDERRTIYVSPHVEAVLGYSREEWLEQPDIWIELLHPEDRERELAAHDEHNRTGEPWVRTYRLIAADGGVVWVRDHAVLTRSAGSLALGTWHGVMLDITAHKAAEEDLRIAYELLEYQVQERTAELADVDERLALEAAERRRVEMERGLVEDTYRTLVERSSAVVYRSTIAPSGEVRLEYASPHVDGMLGYTSKEWRDPDLWVSRVHPQDAQRVLDAWEYSKRTGSPFSEDFRFFAKDGHIVWVHDETALLSRDGTGRPERFIGVMMDITPRKLAETALTDADTRRRPSADVSPSVEAP